MKKTLLLVIAALALPSVALAAKPANVGGKGAPKVMYVLKGKLSAYTAYNAATSTNGSITIMVSSANYHGKALKGQTLTFAVGAKTSVNRSAIKDGDSGIVKVKAPKKIAAADLATTLQSMPANQVVDQGTKHPKH
jgi:hypothetical protein